jgi:hypothetical protein
MIIIDFHFYKKIKGCSAKCSPFDSLKNKGGVQGVSTAGAPLLDAT